MPSLKDGGPNVRNPTDSHAKPVLEVTGLTRSYRDGGGVSDATFTVMRGECLAVLGPSGAGKSTLINLIAGVQRPHTGSIVINGEDVTRTPPGRRNVGIVLQDFPLYDHLDARKNVEMAISSLRLPNEEGTHRVELALKSVAAEKRSHQKARTLSGGERAKIAVARVLARRPDVVLLDEPYSSLDRIQRRPLRTLVREQLKAIGAAVIHVTHSPREAFEIADHICVLVDGKIRQIDTVERIRAEPIDDVVAAMLDPNSD